MRLEHMLFGGRSAGGSERAEAFRDDLAARAFAGIQGDSVTFQVTSLDVITEPSDGSWIDRLVEDFCRRYSASPIMQSDKPGIAAMAAKNVQPAPEPVLSIAGEQVTEREIAQALQLLRGQSAPVGKETPRGLMVVREFDHRLGAWNEA